MCLDVSDPGSPVKPEINGDAKRSESLVAERLWAFTCELTQGCSVSSMVWNKRNPVNTDIFSATGPWATCLFVALSGNLGSLYQECTMICQTYLPPQVKGKTRQEYSTGRGWGEGGGEERMRSTAAISSYDIKTSKWHRIIEKIWKKFCTITSTIQKPSHCAFMCLCDMCDIFSKIAQRLDCWDFCYEMSLVHLASLQSLLGLHNHSSDSRKQPRK